MKNRLAILMLGASMMSVQASSQDVLMRRPLPNRPSSNTPTQPPVVTPPAETPSESPSETEPNSKAYYGWTLECTTPKLSCMEGLVTGTDTTTREVAAQVCPTTQSDDKNELARSRGWAPIGAGINADTGTSVCGGDEPDTPTGKWPNTAYIAYKMCIGGTNEVGCDALTAKSQQDADSGNLDYAEGDVSSCASQDVNDSFYKKLIGDGAGVLAPSDIAATQGSSCTPIAFPERRSVDGSVCQADKSVCMHLDYSVSGEVGAKTYSVYELYENEWDPQACQTPNPSLNADDRIMLGKNGLSAPGLNACSVPDVYAGTGKCTTTTTYDPGWPTSGQSHVETGFKIQCYAVRNAGTENVTTSKVDASLCEGQTPTPAQSAMIATLAPDLVDVHTLDRTCSGAGGLKLNYQRDTLAKTRPADSLYGENIRIMDSFSIRGDGWADFFDSAEYTYTYPFVCTDVEPGTGRRPSYFDPNSANGSSAFKSTLPINRTPCDVGHINDIQGLKDGKVSLQGDGPMTNETVRKECARELGQYQTPTRLAQCGVTYESNNRDTLTVRIRKWRNPAI